MTKATYFFYPFIHPMSFDWSIPFTSKAIVNRYVIIWDSWVAQLLKSLPAMQETPIRFLGWEVSLEEREATHSSILGLPW